jgi:hypothetical protein
MCKPFAPKIEELQRFFEGDIGIAKSINEAIMNSNLSKIQDERVKASFIAINEKNNKAQTGLTSLEKTVVSSMTESLKPVKEIALAALELFAKAELFIAKTFGGANPAYIIGSFTELLASLQEKEQAEMPDKILLGVYTLEGKPLPTNPADRGDLFWSDKQWPQIGSKSDLSKHRMGNMKVSGLNSADTEEFKTSIANGVSEEWESIKGTGQTIDPLKGYPVPLRKRFTEATIKIKKVEYTIDVEEDYVISKQVKNGKLYIIATIKPEAKGKGPKTFAPKPLKIMINFFQLILPIILKRIMPAIQSLQEIIANPPGFLSSIVTQKLQENFEWMDPSLASKPINDPIKSKYFDKEGNDLMAGGAGMHVLGFYLGLKLENGAITPIFEEPKGGIKEIPVVKFVLDMVKAPIEFIMGVIKAFTDLIKAFSNPTKIPGAIADFLSFKWLMELVSPEKLLESVGVKNMDVPFMGTSSTLQQVKTQKTRIEKVTEEFNEALAEVVAFMEKNRAKILKVQADINDKIADLRRQYDEAMRAKEEIAKMQQEAQDAARREASAKIEAELEKIKKHMRAKLAKVEAKLEKIKIKIQEQIQKGKALIQSMMPSMERLDKVKARMSFYMEQLKQLIALMLESYKKAVGFLESLLNGFVNIPFKLFGLCIEPPKIKLEPLMPDLSDLIKLPELPEIPSFSI